MKKLLIPLMLLVPLAANAATVQSTSATNLGGSFAYWAWTWTPLTTTNANGSALLATRDSGDNTVQVTGTFGVGGTIVLQGSVDGTNWYTLNNLAGSAVSFTAAGLSGVAEAPPYIRPFITGGDGTTSLTVVLVKRIN